jgi:hypothetical protein
MLVKLSPGIHLEITFCQRMHEEPFNKGWIILLEVENLTEETYFAGESQVVFRGSETRFENH